MQNGATRQRSKSKPNQRTVPMKEPDPQAAAAAATTGRLLKPCAEEEGEDDDDSTTSTASYNSLNGEVPLWVYTRLDLPFSASTTITCSCMGQVILSPSTVLPEQQQQQQQPDSLSDRPDPAGFQHKPISIVVLGHSNGSVCLVQSETGQLLHAANALLVNNSKKKSPIVDVSIDASGTAVAAVNAMGTVSVWTFSYQLLWSADELSNSNSNLQQQPQQSTLSRLFWGASTTTTTNNTTAHASTTTTTPAATESSTNNVPPPPTDQRQISLSIVDIKSTFLLYSPSEYGAPTCIVLDPAYQKTAPKLLVGFDSGKIVITTRNFWTRVSEHTLLPYQGPPIDHADWRGIECLSWRADTLAFGDCSGVKLFDMQHVKAIAHVDRPSGAAGPNQRPQLCFETSDSLLVAWGDCLLQLAITQDGNNNNNDSMVDPASVSSRRKRVSCQMAWALDCTALGVFPLDGRHVGVLGRVNTEHAENTTELQVIDRTTGDVVWGDILELENETGNDDKDCQFPYCTALASYAVPRMADHKELQEANNLRASSDQLTRFLEFHQSWSVDRVSFREYPPPAPDEDADSVDSDDYNFLLRQSDTAPLSVDRNVSTTAPPKVLVVSSRDLVAGRTRVVDDAIGVALKDNKTARALKLALPRVSQLQKYEIDDLVNLFLHEVLKPLSLRRVKLAVHTLPKLLGGKVHLWEKWAAELGGMPGALFVVRSVLPVRDPKLPSSLYLRVLCKMLEEVEEMRKNPKGRDRLVSEAESHFLNTLVAWGTTRSLLHHVDWYAYQSKSDPAAETMLAVARENLHRREHQSAAGYLDGFKAETVTPPSPANISRVSHDSVDALYDIDELISVMDQLTTMIQIDPTETISPRPPSNAADFDSKVVLDSLARLFVMKNQFEDALKCFLVLGTLHGGATLEEIEEQALNVVNGVSMASKSTHTQYSFVLYLVAKQHLHQVLLEKDFLPDALDSSPIFALVRLVGLTSMGEFLVEHCVAPQSDSESVEGRGTLPLDLVADQLVGSPKLCHWYLHLIFLHKPELYVKFPHTATPPAVITDLHKRHIDLYIKFSGPNRDSAKALEDIEPYRALEKQTPLLKFLKVVLRLGSISPGSVGKLLEVERRGGSGPTLALELAYIMERYGNDSEAHSLMILDLYLKGAQSIMLAVAFAQRVTAHSHKLWETLISHCLETVNPDGSIDGTRFGDLLEAAALCGADLAILVSRIPPGMQVEGLRPRLVAAVADYRLKVQLHEIITQVASLDKILLSQEVSLRAKRGRWCDVVALPDPTENRDGDEGESSSMQSLVDAKPSASSPPSTPVATSNVHRPLRRPQTRPTRRSFAVSIGIR